MSDCWKKSWGGWVGNKYSGGREYRLLVILMGAIKMKSFMTNKGMKLTKTAKFKIKKVLEKDKERVFDIIL